MALCLEQQVRVLAGFLGVSRQVELSHTCSILGGVLLDLTSHTPGVERSPGNGISVVSTKNMTFGRPDTCVAAEQISPLEACHTES